MTTLQKLHDQAADTRRKIAEAELPIIEAAHDLITGATAIELCDGVKASIADLPQGHPAAEQLGHVVSVITNVGTITGSLKQSIEKSLGIVTDEAGEAEG